MFRPDREHCTRDADAETQPLPPSRHQEQYLLSEALDCPERDEGRREVRQGCAPAENEGELGGESHGVGVSEGGITFTA